MNIAPFNTLKFANTLKAAGVPDKQAEAEAEALSDILSTNIKELSTKDELKAEVDSLKSDLSMAELRLEAKLSETKSELVRWVVGAGFLQTALIVGILMKFAKLI